MDWRNIMYIVALSFVIVEINRKKQLGEKLADYEVALFTSMKQSELVRLESEKQRILNEIGSVTLLDAAQNEK